MTSQSEPTTQNGEAMTPQPLPTTAQFIGDVLRAFTEHGMAMERSRDDAATGARNLGFQLRMAHRAMDEGEMTIGKLKEQCAALVDMMGEAVNLLGNHGLNAGDWTSARDALVARWEGPQTDAQPTEAVRGTWEGPTCGEQCEHAPDGGNHPAAPSAG